MVINPRTLLLASALIEEFEGIETQAYLDPVGVPTICAGLTRYPSGMPVRMGDICSAEVCRGHLASVLIHEFMPALQDIPGWSQFGATRQAVLISFAWNLGMKFFNSEGFEAISQVLNEGREKPEIYSDMSKVLQLYVMAGGKRLPGLEKRRIREGEIWDLEDDGSLMFVANQRTYLKRSPIASEYLSDTGKKECQLGEPIVVTRLNEINADSHAWVTLKDSGEKWAVYLPHWNQESTSDGTPAGEGVNWTDFTASVGSFISVGEVLQYDSRRIPLEGSNEEASILEICREFDEIRQAWGLPIGVTSGYRPEPFNAEAGGALESLHVKGMALDIYPCDGKLDDFHNWLFKRWSGGYGDGRQKGFIHIDCRNNGRFFSRAGVKPAAVWGY